MEKSKQTYEFSKGDEIHLDEIYEIRGWVEHCIEGKTPDDMEEEFTVTKSFKVEIIVTTYKK